MKNINLNMLHSLYRVDKKEYDEGHGGSVPPDYIVHNDMERICTMRSPIEAKGVCDTYNEMRIILLEKLLEEAKLS